MTALPLNPNDNNYLSCRLINQQLLQNKMDLTLADNISESPVQPVKVLTDGTGWVILEGNLIVMQFPTSLMKLATLPLQLKPVKDVYMLVPVLRAGTFITNVIKVESSNDGVSGITVTHAGTYSGVPDVSIGSPGDGAIVQTVMTVKSTGITVATAQSGEGSYAPADTITFPYDETNPVMSAAVLTVTHTKVQSATIANGGSGGTNGTQTVTGTTGTGTPFQASVTITGGTITAVNSITVAGDYTVNPSNILAEPVTGASLTGATLNIKMGVLTATRTSGGIYDVVPSNPVTPAGSSGAGTGATFNVQWEVVGILVRDSGSGYTTSSPVTFSGGGVIGSDPATATLTISADDAGQIILQNEPTQGDQIILDNIQFLCEPYF